MRAFTRQPQYSPRINWNNPLTRGMNFCAIGGTPIDLIGNKTGTLVGTVTLQSEYRGKVFRTAGGAANRIDFPVNKDIAGSAYSFASIVTHTSTGVLQYMMFRELAGVNGGTINLLFGIQASDKLQISFGTSGSLYGNITLASNTWYTVSGSTPDDGDIQAYTGSLFVNGVPDTLNTTVSGAVQASTSTNMTLNGRVSDNNRQLTGAQALSVSWHRKLSDAEHKEFAKNPWAIFALDDKVVYSIPSGNTTVNQTLTGKARIQATTNQTETGKARIQVTTTKTETGLGRIQKVVNQTETGIGRITATTQQTETGVARLQVTTTKTETGLGRIQKSVSQTETGLSRITITTVKTETGLSRIQTVVNQTITGVANIISATGTTNQTITGVARIQATTVKTETGLARIQKVVNQTEIGIARIQKFLNQVITGLSRIMVTTVKTETGLARIQVVTNRTITGVSKVNAAGTITQNRTITGVAKIVAIDTSSFVKGKVILSTKPNVTELSTKQVVSTLTTNPQARTVL